MPQRRAAGGIIVRTDDQLPETIDDKSRQIIRSAGDDPNAGVFCLQKIASIRDGVRQKVRKALRVQGQDSTFSYLG